MYEQFTDNFHLSLLLSILFPISSAVSVKLYPVSSVAPVCGFVSSLKSTKYLSPALQVLVLGTYSDGGVVLITPQKKIANGDKLG